MKRHSSFGAVILAIAFFGAFDALAQTPCAMEGACYSHEDCYVLSDRVIRCRRRCYTDVYCTCWRVLCDDYAGSTWLGPCAGTSSSALYCEPKPKCDDPMNADCDDVADHNTGTPIVLDVDGNGIRLTSGAQGVAFDLDADGTAEALAWTEGGSDDAWLVLDRNGNGNIDDGKELFGDATAQPPSTARNGYRALAVFDDDGNQIIEQADGVWPLLSLWRDANHDGIAQAWELSSLESAGITGLDLLAKSDQRRDRYGNVFRYRGAVRTAKPGTVGHWSYDVILAKP